MADTENLPSREKRLSALLRSKSRWHVAVGGTDYWAHVPKREVRALVSYMGGWEQLDVIESPDGSVFCSVIERRIKDCLCGARRPSRY